MTIICPRCAVRFSVTVPIAATVTPSCPACGTWVPVRSDQGRGSSAPPQSESPSGLWRSSRSMESRPARQPTTDPELVLPPAELDLPLPKRPRSDSPTALGAAEPRHQPAEPPGERRAATGGQVTATPLRLRPEVLADLPMPLGPVKELPLLPADGASAAWERKRAEETAQGIPPVVPTMLRPAPRSQPVVDSLPSLPKAAEPLRVPVTRPELSLPPLSSRDGGAQPARPELAADALLPVATAAQPAIAPAGGSAAAPAPPSDRTAPEPAEAMEQRMSLSPAPRAPELLAHFAAAAVAAAASRPAAATPQPPAASDAAQQSGSAESAAASADERSIDSAASERSRSGSSSSLSDPSGLHSSSAERTAAKETGELAEPPQLPLGWIIGALFALALLLTLWIAHRAGVFSVPSPGLPPYGQPSSAGPPRMP